MRILLTGGAGYIGTHTAVELLKAGHEVTVLDNFSNSSPLALARVQLISGKHIRIYKADLTDYTAVRRIFHENSFDAVIHFAGLKAVAESVDNPLLYYRVNLISSIVLLQVMAEFGVKKMVFSSSATVYGATTQVPIDESSAVGIGVTNPYGQTKAMIERILLDAAAANQELELCILRYFNPVGAHESGLIGESPEQTPNNLFPVVSQVAVGGREFVSVFGDNYPTADGTGVRDYVHVVDLAEGHVAAVEHLRAGVSIFNLGTGEGKSVLEVIRAFERASGRKISYRLVHARAGDVAISVADVGKAEQFLQWVARRSLDEACQDSWKWQVKNPHGYAA